MGYQVVSITLRDGRRFDNVTVVGGIISRLPAVSEWFSDEEIEDIVVTHGTGV